MSIHRAKKVRCTLCRPPRKFRTKSAVRQHAGDLHEVVVVNGIVHHYGCTNARPATPIPAQGRGGVSVAVGSAARSL